jgi:hypothetical protein
MATYQHVLPGTQAEAARTFASVVASPGFNPVERSGRSHRGAMKP